jgi:hypothetical protein
MRLRVRTEGYKTHVSSTKSGSWYNGSSCIPYNDPQDYGEFDTFYSYSRIADKGGERVGNIPNPVDHFRVYGKALAMPSPYCDYSPQCGLVTELFNCDVPLVPQRFIDVFPDYNGKLNAFGTNAFNEFYQQMPDTTSLANFILEWKEVAGMAQQATKLAADLERAIGRLFQYGDSSLRTNLFRIKSIGELLRLLRNIDLGTSFGVEPLIRDIKAFATVLQTVTARLAALKGTNGSVRRVHHTESFDTIPTFSNPGDPTGRVYHNISLGFGSVPHFKSRIDVSYRLVYCRAKCRASALLEARLENLDSWYSTFTGLLATLGLNNPAKVIWNAIPFSFVVDWLYNVSGALGALAIRPLRGTWRVYNTCYTVTSYAVVEIGVRYFGSDWYFAGHIPVKQFLRVPGLPVGPNVLPTNPSLGHKVLMAELLDQRVRK